MTPSGNRTTASLSLTASAPDVALTMERFQAGLPILIISQRFYQHCLKHGIPPEVRPARIDPA